MSSRRFPVSGRPGTLLGLDEFPHATVSLYKANYMHCAPPQKNVHLFLIDCQKLTDFSDFWLLNLWCSADKIFWFLSESITVVRFLAIKRDDRVLSLTDRIEATKFRDLVSKLQKFLSCRLFPQNEDDLPPVSKCAWWIPCVTKVMALLSQ